MGLDNGIVLKVKSTELPLWVQKMIEFTPYNGVDICYWRKCWGLRDTILTKVVYDYGDSRYNLLEGDIHEIRKILRYFSNRKRWEDEGRSIWAYEDIRRRLFKQRIVLWWLERYLRKNPTVECYFYDSY